MNPFFFLVGVPRSSNTLLQRLLDAHSEIAVIDETRWIAKWWQRRIGVGDDGAATPALASRLLEHPRFARLGIGKEDLLGLLRNGGPVPYASFVTGIFDMYGKARGKAHVGDKTPSYLRDMPTLHDLWPSVRFVHIIRDGRDVALALRDWTQKKVVGPRRFEAWNDDPLLISAIWWERHIRLGREDAGSLDPALYTETRFESLVPDPGRELQRLSGFLGVAYDEGMLHFHEGRMQSDPGLSPKKAWLPPTAGLRDWRRDMPRGDVERFEAAAGDLLEELGYERACPNPADHAVSQAAAMRNAFTLEARARGSRLPSGWEEG